MTQQEVRWSQELTMRTHAHTLARAHTHIHTHPHTNTTDEVEDALAEQGETGAESGKKRGLPEVGGNVHSVSKKFKS